MHRSSTSSVFASPLESRARTIWSWSSIDCVGVLRRRYDDVWTTVMPLSSDKVSSVTYARWTWKKRTTLICCHQLSLTFGMPFKRTPWAGGILSISLSIFSNGTITGAPTETGTETGTETETGTGTWSGPGIRPRVGAGAGALPWISRLAWLGARAEAVARPLPGPGSWPVILTAPRPWAQTETWPATGARTGTGTRATPRDDALIFSLAKSIISPSKISGRFIRNTGEYEVSRVFVHARREEDVRQSCRRCLESVFLRVR